MLTAYQSIEEFIIALLANKPGLTVEVIHREHLHRIGKCTLQAIYKELKKLEARGVILKTQKHYSLTRCFASEFLSLSKQIQNNYFGVQSEHQVLDVIQKKRRLRFTKMLRMKNLWSELVLTLGQTSRTKTLLSWNPHPLFYLLQTMHESQVLRTMQMCNTKMFKMVGGRNTLDQWAAQFWKRPHVEYSFSEGPFEQQRSTYFSIIDDTIITVDLDGKTTHDVESFYRQDQPTQSELMSFTEKLSTAKILSTIEVICNPKKAAAFRRKFSEFFGVSI